MRWPWHQRRPAPAETPSGDVLDAAEARRRAEEALQRTQEQTPEVRALAEQLRHHRRVNHFAELFGKSLEGPR